MKALINKSLAISALALAVSACTTLPKAPTTVLAQPNLSLNETFEVEPSDTQTISTNSSPSIAAMRWQDFYSDDKLKALIELGLANNKSFEQAVLTVQKAQAAYQIRRVGNVPTLNGSGGYSYGASGQDQNPSGGYSVGLGLASYELDLWGKVANTKEAALQEYLATSAGKDSAQISLIAGIAQAYVNISYAKAQLILAESTLKSREHSLFITQKRFEAGVDSKSPSLQAEGSLEAAKMAIVNAKTSLAKAENALQLLIGSPVPAELMPEPALTSIVSPTLFNTGLPSELLFYRPDIAQKEYVLKAAGANINVARAAFFPSIKLSGNLGFRSTELSDLFKSAGQSWSFGPSITVPIFNAGALKSQYEVAELTQKQALADYEYAIQTAFSEVSDLLAERGAMDEQLNSQYKLQKNYQQTYDIAYATFRSGLSNYLNVLDAERSLFGVQQDILNTEQRKVLSQVALYKTLGGGASLGAEQVTNQATQTAAMTSARLATKEEVQTLAGDRSPAVLQLVPNAISQSGETLEVETPKTAGEVPVLNSDETSKP